MSFFCEGCDTEIKGTTSKPANAWHTHSGTLCDDCHDSRCSECGALTAKMPPDDVFLKDDRWICADCVCLDGEE